MKLNKHYLLIILLGFSMAACTGTKENTTNEMDATMIGDWNVQWITSPDESMSTDEPINLTMNGKMLIKEDKTITIEAYGYQGCIFGTDTLIHTLNWEINGDTLNLKNLNDEFGIPYVIKDAAEGKVKLQLLDDVFLFLTK
ncbi:MAG: hypothetical protein OCD76_23890 [Reichenbachiella sp.]